MPITDDKDTGALAPEQDAAEPTGTPSSKPGADVDFASSTLTESSPRATHLKEDDAATPRSPPAEQPFSIYTKREKWIIVGLVSFGSLFSPLTANIYFPAIPTLSKAFHKNTELINLTVTVYMVLQGGSPMLWGPMADRIGRRPIFLACLLILSLSCVGLALVPTSDYWLLMLLRCIQAAGSASTVALASGVMGDIATRAERGGFVGVSGIGALASNRAVIGGGLTQGLGWRSIFWFLCIASAACFLFLFLVLPETLRAIVGNGSIPAARIYTPGIPFLGRSYPKSDPSVRPPPKPTQNPFELFTYPDIVTLLVFNGLVYAVFYAVLTPVSYVFVARYPYLSQTSIGLCFLAIGGGMVLGTTVTGRILDYQYRVLKEQIARTAGEAKEAQGAAELLKEENFPIEWARLQSAPVYLLVITAATVGYGWCLRRGVTLAVPLILHIIIGYTFIGFMNTVQTLIVDLLPNRGSSVTAANNLVRCSLGAATTAVIDLIITAVGEGWTYTIMGAICVSVAPLIWLEIRMGPVWRERRRKREEWKAEERKEKNDVKI